MYLVGTPRFFLVLMLDKAIFFILNYLDVVQC